MNRRRGLSAAVVAAAALAALTGCGTTVDTRGLADAPQELGGAPLPEASAPSTSTHDGSAPALPQQPGQAPGQGDTTALPTALPTGRPSGGPIPVGPGITASTIRIGIIYSDNANAANEAYGVKGTGASLDPRRLYRIVLDDMNARGGIAGRKLEPVFANVDSNSGFDTSMQSVCSAFTEDTKVFAVFGGYFVNDSLRDCLDKHGVVLLDSGESIADQRTFERYPAYFEISMLNLTHAAALVVDRSVAKGGLRRGDRIGVLTFEETAYERAAKEGTVAALARHGLAPQVQATMPIAYTTDHVGAQASAISSIVLRFKREQVDRVLFVETQGDIALLFMTAAHAQAYHPHYLLGSGDGGALLPQNVPTEQLKDALGVGWLPIFDVDASQDPESKANASRKRCLALFAKHGETFSRAQEGAPLGICDHTWFLHAVMSPTALSKSAVTAAVSGLGSRFESTLAFATDYRADKHDGAAAYRDFVYVDACTCYRWSSGVQRVH